MNLPVKVIVIENIKPITLPDGTVFSARRGEERELPRWVSLFLEKKGLVKRRGVEITLDEIIKLHYREVNRRSITDLEQLPAHFYWLVKEYLEHLDEMIRERPDPTLIDERRKVSLYLREIFEKRLQALVSLTVRGGDLSVIRQKLSPEENVLLEEIHGKISAWKRIVLGAED
jgi:hypothetical protein